MVLVSQVISILVASVTGDPASVPALVNSAMVFVSRANNLGISPVAIVVPSVCGKPKDMFDLLQQKESS